MNKFSATEAKDVGIWIRVSSEEQAQGDSPEHHLERGKAYAAARGWVVKEVYNLAGVSGKSVVANAEAQRMMRDIKSKHITGLIFSKLARLSRNKRELEDFSEFFQAQNADMISIQDSIDTSTPSGRMFYTFQAAQTHWEREEITERIKASVSIRAKLGKTINGRAPYGYQWKDRKLVVQPDEAPIRRKAFELFLRYRRYGTVAKLLTAAGHRTREGGIWYDLQVKRCLRESSAKGVYYFNRVTQDKKAVKPESEWGKVECEAIVTGLSSPVFRDRRLESRLNRQTGMSALPGAPASGTARWACAAAAHVDAPMPPGGLGSLQLQGMIPTLSTSGRRETILSACLPAGKHKG